jgi:hypothetical protein
MIESGYVVCIILVETGVPASIGLGMYRGGASSGVWENTGIVAECRGTFCLSVSLSKTHLLLSTSNNWGGSLGWTSIPSRGVMLQVA